MGNPNELDRELLSAYLDGALESSERLRAETLLATNAVAERYFNQLQITRQCLKSVPSSRLRSSFTARVLERARDEALAQRLPSDHHVLRAVPTADAAHSQDLGELVTSRQPTTTAPPMADFGLARGSESTSSTDDEAAGRVRLRSADGDHRSTGRLRRDRSLAWAAMAVAAAVLGGLAVLPWMGTDQSSEVIAERVPQSAPQPETMVAAADAPTPEEQTPVGRPDGVAHVMQGAGALDALKDDLQAMQMPTLDFLMIIDAAVSTDGWETGRFEELLDQFGIPIASPIVTDSAFIDVLEETRVVVGSTSSDASGQQPRAALIYLRADGATLDRLYQAMHADRQSFPRVLTDISIGDNSQLHKLLRAQAMSRPPREASARVLSAAAGEVGSEEVVPQFVPARRKGMENSENAPALPGANSTGLNLGGQMPMSEALIILRVPTSD